MTLATGTRLGAYEVVALIGAGGMGEVYRARDTRLGRDVAIKILPEALAADAQFRERFEREARAISRLSHPNICTLHDVGDLPGAMPYLVMEHLDGELLEDRINRGPLPVAEALAIGVEMADALCAAHRAGIVHRDLKPGNIFLARTGSGHGSRHAKLLDFGLAKTAAPIVSMAGSVAPTTPPNITAQGAILGTFQYMAPEQIEGAEADARTDIFAFGAVLYEMLTGRTAFEGKSRASLLGAILKDEPPPVSQVQPLTPSALDRIVATCLAKDPDDRWQTARDLRRELTWVAEGAGGATAAAIAQLSRGRRFSGLTLATISGVALLAAIGLAGWTVMNQMAEPQPQPMRFGIVLPAVQSLSASPADHRRVAISADGRYLAYTTQSGGAPQLRIRAIDRLDAEPLRGPVQPRGPFFSPDGKWLGYFEANSELKKVAISGGPAIALARLTGAPRGASWAPDDTIVFATGDPTTGLLRVPGSGGEPVALTKPDPAKGERDHIWPSVLPNGRAVLFTITGSGAVQIAVVNVQTGERKTLIQGGSGAQYVESGHIVYGTAGTLRAVRFDPERLEISGDPIPLVDPVAFFGSQGLAAFGAPELAVARNGALVYVPRGSGAGGRSLTWVDRQGREEPITAPSRVYFALRLSPDGTRVAVDIRDQDNDIWIWELARHTLNRLTFNPANDIFPVWFPDGRRIAYRSGDQGTPGSLFSQSADGTGVAETLGAAPHVQFPMSFSPDGKRLVVTELIPTQRTSNDLGLIALDGKRETMPLVHTPFVEGLAEVSPDGRWMAYQSNESGHDQIYVRPFPDVNSGRWLISAAGGTKPVWNPNGRELFYLDGSGAMTAVPIQTAPTFAPGNPTTLFEGRYFSAVQARSYDVSRDGKRFLMIKETFVSDAAPDATPANLIVVVNWLEELKRLAPAR